MAELPPLLAHSWQEYQELKKQYPDRTVKLTFKRQLQLKLEEKPHATDQTSN